MRLFFHALILLPLLSACSKTLGRHPAQHVTSALTPMNHQVLDWAESTVCSTYFFNFRFRADRAKDGATGARVGIVSPGSVLGGQAPDVDSADALANRVVGRENRFAMAGLQETEHGLKCLDMARTQTEYATCISQCPEDGPDVGFSRRN